MDVLKGCMINLNMVKKQQFCSATNNNLGTNPLKQNTRYTQIQYKPYIGKPAENCYLLEIN